MKAVLYWLGAGASAQALPIVKDMSAALLAHAFWLKNHHRPPKGYFDYMVQLSEAIKPYGTVDTYARSLFLQGRRERELNELKLHLSYFFMIEQLYSEKKLAEPQYEREQAIDTRYMGWLALLLQERSVLRSGVNVISWNYDVQVQHALTKYLPDADIGGVYESDTWAIYPDLRPPGRPKEHLPFLVHLNGKAGLVDDRGVHRLLIKDIGKQDTKTILERWFLLYEGRERNEVPLQEQMKHTFCFAWEKSPVAKDAMHYAKKLMNAADVLVVIGYSFPLFNREVDYDLLHAFIQPEVALGLPEGSRHPKRIVIQNPSLTGESFKRMFEMTAGGYTPDVESIPDAMSFHVPAELFRPVWHERG